MVKPMRWSTGYWFKIDADGMDGMEGSFMMGSQRWIGLLKAAAKAAGL